MYGEIRSGVNESFNNMNNQSKKEIQSKEEFQKMVPLEIDN